MPHAAPEHGGLGGCGRCLVEKSGNEFMAGLFDLTRQITQNAGICLNKAVSS